jgi:hypothetical protein
MMIEGLEEKEEEDQVCGKEVLGCIQIPDCDDVPLSIPEGIGHSRYGLEAALVVAGNVAWPEGNGIRHLGLTQENGVPAHAGGAQASAALEFAANQGARLGDQAETVPVLDLVDAIPSEPDGSEVLLNETGEKEVDVCAVGCRQVIEERIMDLLSCPGLVGPHGKLTLKPRAVGGNGLHGRRLSGPGRRPTISKEVRLRLCD